MDNDMPDELIIGECIFGLFQELLEELPPAFRHLVYKRPGEFYISLPERLLNYAVDYQGYLYRSCYHSGIPFAPKVFEGIKLLPSHELAITLFHKDGPLYQHITPMVVKIPLLEASKKTENGGKITILLRKVFNFNVPGFNQN